MITIKSDTGLVAQIDELGAQLSRLADNTTEYLWNGNPEIWPDHSPVLFPFVGRLPNKKYTYRGKAYSMTIHGFASTSCFEVCEKTDNCVKLHLINTDSIKEMYPFDFDFWMTYTLVGNTLEVTYEVRNNGSDVLPYGLGSHPGFNVPFNKNLSFEDYYIEFPNAKDVYRHLFTPTCFDTGKDVPSREVKDGKMALRHDLFDDDAILLKNTGFRAILKADKDSKKIIVDYPDTPWCAFWHNDREEVPFVCIEPWFSLPGKEGVNDIEFKDDFFHLGAGKTNRHCMRITVE